MWWQDCWHHARHSPIRQIQTGEVQTWEAVCPVRIGPDLTILTGDEQLAMCKKKMRPVYHHSSRHLNTWYHLIVRVYLELCYEVSTPSKWGYLQPFGALGPLGKWYIFTSICKQLTGLWPPKCPWRGFFFCSRQDISLTLKEHVSKWPTNNFHWLLALNVKHGNSDFETRPMRKWN